MSAPESPFDRLTPGQRKALAAVCECGGNAEAAETLGVSVQTVKNHLIGAFDVLGTRTIADTCARWGEERARRDEWERRRDGAELERVECRQSILCRPERTPALLEALKLAIDRAVEDHGFALLAGEVRFAPVPPVGSRERSAGGRDDG